METIHDRIKKLRLQKNMTQAELAELVGYSGKSMISKVEKGLVDLAIPMVEKFAQALDTTPSYLMGWTDDPSPNVPEPVIEYANPGAQSSRLHAYADRLLSMMSDVVIQSDDEEKLLAAFRSSDDATKAIIWKILDIK